MARFPDLSSVQSAVLAPGVSVHSSSVPGSPYSAASGVVSGGLVLEFPVAISPVLSGAQSVVFVPAVSVVLPAVDPEAQYPAVLALLPPVLLAPLPMVQKAAHGIQTLFVLLAVRGPSI